MEAKITFKDGSEITAEANGNNYITESEPEFPEDLSVVTVRTEGEGAEEEKVFHNPKVTECASLDGRFWFAFVEESEQDKVIRELQEQNDMLTECLLEMSEIVYGGDN